MSCSPRTLGQVPYERGDCRDLRIDKGRRTGREKDTEEVVKNSDQKELV